MTVRSQVSSSLPEAGRQSDGDFQTAARAILDTARTATNAASGYLALLEECTENRVAYCGANCSRSVDHPQRVLIRGLQAIACRRLQVVYDNDFANTAWAGSWPDGHIRLDSVMFGPVVDNGAAVGIIGLTNKHGGFNGKDARLVEGFCQIASIAIVNAKKRLAFDDTLERLETRNRDLEQMLGRVKSLDGLLSICCSCKKIRDNKGQWHELERYISSHSHADFSHGICPDCLGKLYPEYERRHLPPESTQD